MTRVGSYELVELIGEGATGAVHRALGADGTEVAVKLLRAEYANEAVVRARFLREARITGEIGSLHVVQVFEAGDDGETAYLVMPLYRGGSLAGRLEAGPVELCEALDLAAQLGKGLDVLHDRAILHRDVKPSNVLLDGTGLAALTDFGLARAAGSTRLTRDGQLLGTVAYLAPELIEGDEATRASDVYALGCVLYECLAGLPPFVGATEAEVGFAHLVEPPPELPGPNAELSFALLTALAKSPAERPTSGTALARMLHLARSSGQR
ncbi:MAG TPA: serine/threonine-protein kinase [Gaiellaceae bacterium]|jgi:serine/threonine-protein kinase|nr:serine/threonine-protein kinase [Gaiellaceae bacterium]